MKKLIYFKNNALVGHFCGKGSKLVPYEIFSKYTLDFSNNIVICYGIVNYEMMVLCIKNKINFIYLDNGYFGNLNSYHTPRKSKKNFYRVVYNDTVLKTIIERKSDRLKNQLRYLKKEYGVGKFIKSFKTDGRNILIIPPSGKVLDVCNINSVVWIDEVVNKVQSQTDLTPIIRNRTRTRHERFAVNPIQNDLQNAYATISFNSCAAVESLLFGVPSFIYDNTLSKHFICSPAKPVSVLGLDNLSDRIFPENRLEWLYHLAYGQFSREELGNGYALKFILDGVL